MRTKIKVSVAFSPELVELADSIAETEERSRSFVIEKAALAGLEKMDSPKAKAIREKSKKAKK